jgi:hypothetical protein
MQSLPYSELSQSQLDQVTYLFADQHFGTDAAAFTYELDQDGEIKGRAAISIQLSAKARAKQAAPVTVIAIQEVHVTENQVKHASMSMDALAASIARKLYQTEKVQQEISV